MKISTHVFVSSAHFLPGYKGKCANLHGHNWRISVTVWGGVGENGMVLDFSTIKNAIKEKLDHTLLNFRPDRLYMDPETGKLRSPREVNLINMVLRSFGVDPDKPGVLDNPTAENLAAYVGELVIQCLEKAGNTADDIYIQVRESNTSYADACLGKDF